MPGAAAFSSAGLLARLPISMMGIAIVLLVIEGSGSYGLAGLVAATFTVVNAVAAPQVARLVDRHGQRRVVPGSVAAHAFGVLTLLGLVAIGAPTGALLAAAIVAGAGFPSVGSLVRSRWSFLLSGATNEAGRAERAEPAGAGQAERAERAERAEPAGAGQGGRADPRLQTAFAWESIVDEMIFVVGPPLTVLVATVSSPTAALLLALGALVGGSVVLLSLRGTEPPARPRDSSARGTVLREPALVVVVVTMAAIGTVFGTVEVVTIAFAEEQGSPGAAGIPLSIYSLGSMVAGLAYGTVRWHISIARRFAAGCLVMVVSLVPLPFVSSLPGLCAVLFLAGVAIAPTLIAGFAATERAVPSGRLTEGLTWASTGVAIGVATGAALAGRVTDELGAQPAYAIAVVGAGVAAVVSLAGCRRVSLAVRRREQLAEASSVAGS